jgi:hypothetical protein
LVDRNRALDFHRDLEVLSGWSMKVTKIGSLLDVDNMEAQGIELSGYAPQSALWLLVG